VSPVLPLTPVLLPLVLPLLLVVGLLLLGFIKISVVLAVLRKGIGGGIPSGLLVWALSLLFAGVAMLPVIERSTQALSLLPKEASSEALLSASSEPVRAFLRAHTPQREQQLMLQLTTRLRQRSSAQTSVQAPMLSPVQAPVQPTDLQVLLPAFAISELRVAFLLGVLLLLPFLLIDLLCAVLLSGLSLGSLSPRAVALPFKLLLFVLCDGWHLLIRSLLLGFA
jgi:flagellar biosynthesis protein FliP